MIVHQKRLLVKYDPAVTTFVYYSIATLFTMTLCMVVSYQFRAAEFIFNGDALPWIAVAYASVFATLFAYNATSWANKRLSPSMTTAYNTLQPFDTVLLSFILLAIIPSPSEMVGGLIIAAGLVVTVYGRCVHLSITSSLYHVRRIIELIYVCVLLYGANYFLCTREHVRALIA